MLSNSYFTFHNISLLGWFYSHHFYSYFHFNYLTQSKCCYRDEQIVDKQQYRGKLHLLAGEQMEFCLNASPKQKLTSKESKRGSLSPCKREANQVVFVFISNKMDVFKVEIS